MVRSQRWEVLLPVGLFTLGLAWTVTSLIGFPGASGQEPPGVFRPAVIEPAPADLLGQTAEAAAAKSQGCVSCHKEVRDPHFKETLHIGCCDCHGGDPTSTVKETAHVRPRYPEAWLSSANPVR